MTAIRTPKRGRKASQVFDPSDWRQIFFDQRQWVVLGRVDRHDGEATHFRFDVDALGQRALFVDVVSIPGDVELTCVLPGEGGIWRIPAVGRQVYVALPDGIIDGWPSIIAVVGEPAEASGLSESTAVIQLAPGQRLLVHDGDAADAKRLATIDDVQAVVTYIDKQMDPAHGHVHSVVGAATVTITTAAGPYSTPVPEPAPAPEGTQTLEVK